MTIQCTNCKYCHEDSEAQPKWTKSGAGTPYRCNFEKDVGVYVSGEWTRECDKYEEAKK